MIEIRDVGLAARVGEVAPALEPDGVEALLAGLAATDRRNVETAQGSAAGQDVGDELRPLLELARTWQPTRRQRSGVTA